MSLGQKGDNFHKPIVGLEFGYHFDFSEPELADLQTFRKPASLQIIKRKSIKRKDLRQKADFSLSPGGPLARWPEGWWPPIGPSWLKPVAGWEASAQTGIRLAHSESTANRRHVPGRFSG